MISKQETFNVAAVHLLKQGQRSLSGGDENNGCFYRGDNGCMCPVGVFIPDDEYDPELEGCDVTWLFDNPNFHLPSLKQHDLDLLHDLQDLHDYKDPAEWKKWLRVLAAYHYLDDTILREAKND